MNRSLATALAAAALLAGPASQAQEASAAPQPASQEPKVERIVIEDGGSRIEELRVRGTTQRIVVRPKVGTTQSYEIITDDGSREMFDGSNTSRGAAGKRVCHILSF